MDEERSAKDVRACIVKSLEDLFTRIQGLEKSVKVEEDRGDSTSYAIGNAIDAWSRASAAYFRICKELAILEKEEPEIRSLSSFSDYELEKMLQNSRVNRLE